MSDVDRVVTVIGAGVAGTMAIEKAINNKAHVKIIELLKRLDELRAIYGDKNVNIFYQLILQLKNH